MARGRQQKWICLDCGAAFAVQGIAPKMCCACGSARLGRAPSLELAENFAEKRLELEQVCHELNGAYGRYASLKTRYDEIMAYWKQQKRRGKKVSVFWNNGRKSGGSIRKSARH